MRLKAIDFFCGAGGLTRGLLDAGIQVLAGVDIDSRLKETYEKNNGPSRFINLSIDEIDIFKIREELGITSKDIVIYAACTPCQPFSTLNRMKGQDERKSLILSFAELVKLSPPDFILVENVPGLSNAYGREVYSEFISIIEELGFLYRFEDKIDAYEYGVPQNRKRHIMIASRNCEIAKPAKSRIKRTVEDAIAYLPRIEAGETHATILNHSARAVSEKIMKIISSVPKDGGSRRDIEDTSILLKCHQDKPNVHKDVFGRMKWGGPAPTLTARCTDSYCGRFIHPEQNRGISLREAAALQTFPDDYEFFGSYHHIQRQIGNAVPAELARRLGLSILKTARRMNR